MTGLPRHGRLRGPARLLHPTLLALAGALAVTLAGCGRDVAVPAPDSPSPACLDLTLPDTVNGAGHRPTSEPGTAAWGEPPITWRCGIPRPAALTADATLLDVDGVAWLPVTAQGGDVFYAVNWPTQESPVYIEVAVPSQYSAPADVLLDLGPALR